MKARRLTLAHFGLFLFAALWFLVVVPLSAMAAPYAAYVIDARTGKVIHSRNADTRLHPGIPDQDDDPLHRLSGD